MGWFETFIDALTRNWAIVLGAFCAYTVLAIVLALLKNKGVKITATIQAQSVAKLIEELRQRFQEQVDGVAKELVDLKGLCEKHGFEMGAFIKTMLNANQNKEFGLVDEYAKYYQELCEPKLIIAEIPTPTKPEKVVKDDKIALE